MKYEIMKMPISSLFSYPIHINTIFFPQNQFQEPVTALQFGLAANHPANDSPSAWTSSQSSTPVPYQLRPGSNHSYMVVQQKPIKLTRLYPWKHGLHYVTMEAKMARLHWHCAALIEIPQAVVIVQAKAGTLILTA